MEDPFEELGDFSRAGEDWLAYIISSGGKIVGLVLLLPLFVIFVPYLIAIFIKETIEGWR